MADRHARLPRVRCFLISYLDLYFLKLHQAKRREVSSARARREMMDKLFIVNSHLQKITETA